MKRISKCSLTFLACVCLIVPTHLSLGETNVAAVTVDNFHRALAAGKRDEVMSLLQPDALIVESGIVQTRAEYEREHLDEDIAYARDVPGKRLNVLVRQEGDVAWVTSTFRLTGQFHDQPVDSFAAETMLLTKTSAGWRIGAIHWSSHKASKE